MNVHPSSVVSPEAILAEDVTIGPFCLIRGKVRIGKGTHLESHVSIGSEHGSVEIGENNQISAGVALGGDPQDKKYRGEQTQLIIGNNNQIREYVSMSLGTATGTGKTVIGNNNMIMAYTHFGHDCHLGDDNVIANASQFAGHVHVDNRVIIGGMCAFNQHVKVGSFGFVAGYSGVNKDLLPFTMSQGNYAVCRATNKIGLERAGVKGPDIENIHKAIRIIIKGSSTIAEGLQRISEECRPTPEIQYLVNFIKTSKRGVAK